jgi:hypothetical protein
MYAGRNLAKDNLPDHEKFKTGKWDYQVNKEKGAYSSSELVIGLD